MLDTEFSSTHGTIMETQTTDQHANSVAARLAAEDIQPGDFITVLNEMVELPSFLWHCLDSTHSLEEPIRVRYMPVHSGQPFRVITVCLPFVYTKPARGGLEIFDVRQHQLVRLCQTSGPSLWKRLRKTTRKKKKKDKRQKSK